MSTILHKEEKFLAKMAPAELAGQLMILPARKRLELLLDRPDAGAVVAALPEGDFYMFVKELGEDAAGPLLALATPEQFTHLTDLEGWQRDQILPGRMLAWCDALLHANEGRFLAWLVGVDFELLVLLFKEWLDLAPLREEDDPADEEEKKARLTIDGQNYYLLRYPRYQALITYILSFLFERHHPFYDSLLQHVRMFAAAEAHELAFRFHRGRLQDNGIPDYEEAGTIYHPLPVNRVSRVTKDVGGTDNAGAPGYPLTVIPEGDLLAQALAGIESEPVRQSLKLELVGLANKILVADDLAPDAVENQRFSLEKCAAYVNLGLEEYCAATALAGAEAVSRVPLEELFRIAAGRIRRELRPLSNLLESGWLGHWPHGLDILDGDWREMADLLCAPTPRIVRQNEARTGPGMEDFFRVPWDLHRAAKIIGIFVALEPLYRSFAPEEPDGWLEYALWDQGQIPDLASVTMGALVLTATVNVLAGRSWSPVPLDVNEWPLMAARLTAETLESGLRDQLGRLLAAEDVVAAAVYFKPLFDAVRAEKMPEDPRLVPWLLLAPA